MATFGEGSTLTFSGEALGEIISISFSAARGTIETTSLGTSGGGKTFIPASFYEGEMSVECYADPGGTDDHTAIEAFLSGATPTDTPATLTFSVGGTNNSYSASAIPTGIETGVGLESAATTTYSFKLTGGITIAN